MTRIHVSISAYSLIYCFVLNQETTENPNVFSVIKNFCFCFTSISLTQRDLFDGSENGLLA